MIWEKLKDAARIQGTLSDYLVNVQEIILMHFGSNGDNYQAQASSKEENSRKKIFADATGTPSPVKTASPVNDVEHKTDSLQPSKKEDGRSACGKKEGDFEFQSKSNRTCGRVVCNKRRNHRQHSEEDKSSKVRNRRKADGEARADAILTTNYSNGSFTKMILCGCHT